MKGKKPLNRHRRCYFHDYSHTPCWQCIALYADDTRKVARDGRKRRPNLAQKIEWLCAHTELSGKPHDDVVKAMKTDGIISKSTMPIDVCLPKKWGKRKSTTIRAIKKYKEKAC